MPILKILDRGELALLGGLSRFGASLVGRVIGLAYVMANRLMPRKACRLFARRRVLGASVLPRVPRDIDVAVLGGRNAGFLVLGATVFPEER